MKPVLEVCLVAFAMTCLASAQDATKPVPRPGIDVEMAEASHAVEIRAADEESATVVSVTADGKVFLGVKPVEVGALNSLNAGTVFVKADARVPHQKILTVLDALRSHPVVLLTAPPFNVKEGTMVWPYGLRMNLGSQ